ncbi:MAG: DNA-binding GntR family transcriptional regulator [bacterium]|jgi:DNA-binding GntR family transcriptional regulator
MIDAMANHAFVLDALERGDLVAVRTAIEAVIGGAASDLEEYLPE